MGKLRRDLRIAMAGACSGLFSVSVFLLAARVQEYYDYLGWREQNGYAARYDPGVQELWWVPVVVWHVVLSIVAAFLIHRYLATERASTFLRWQAIGVVALVGWGLTVFIGIGMDCLIRGNTRAIEQTLSLVKLTWIAQFVAAVFASNVLYGSAIQAASAEAIHEESQTDTSER